MSKQAKIQDAVAAIILAEGPTGVSTTKVARRVGIAQSNVYLYFKNKQELIDSVYRRELDRIINTTQLVTLADSTRDLAVRVRSYVQQVYAYASAHPDSLTLIQQIKSLRGQGLELTDGADDPHNIVVQLLTTGIRDKVLKDLPVSLHMGLVFSIIHTHTTNVARGLYPADQYDFEQLFAFIWDAMRRA